MRLTCTGCNCLWCYTSHFLLTPVGVLVVAIGGGAMMWTLWRNKKLPLAVEEVGKSFKSRYDAAEGNRSVIDGLKEEAISALLRKLLWA